MARSIQQISLFLASPGDVDAERNVIREVANEVNRSIARDKGIHIEVIGWDTDGYATNGADAQSLLNDQIGNMADYDLFVGVLWNRFGTPTPRAGSGTEEEFDRALASYEQIGHPNIMFYFSEAPFTPKSQTDLDQKSKIFEIKERARKNNVMTWDYADATHFRIIFQRQLQAWLVRRTVLTPNPPSSSTSTPAISSALHNGKQAFYPENGNLDTATNPQNHAPNQVVNQVSDSGAWTLLGTDFFESQTVSERSDGSIVIEIEPKTSEEDAALRSFQSDGIKQNGNALPFAYQDTASIASVLQADRRSSGGKNTWIIMLKTERNQVGRFSEVQYSNYSPDVIASMRAQFILRGELPTEKSEMIGENSQRGMDMETSLLQSLVRGNIGEGSDEPGRGPLADLWRRFQGNSQHFLPLARLWSVYHLLTTNTVEHVLELTIGPMEGTKLHVKFRGRRPRVYTNFDPVQILVDGLCDLST